MLGTDLIFVIRSLSFVNLCKDLFWSHQRKENGVTDGVRVCE